MMLCKYFCHVVWYKQLTEYFAALFFVLVLFFMGIIVLQTLVFYNSTTFSPRSKYRTLIESHALQVIECHQYAAVMNRNVPNHVLVPFNFGIQ